MAINFPNNPVVGDTHTVGTSVWRWNGYAWIRIPDPGAKGEKGDGGQKGDQGITGDKGNQGDKGEKGDVEAQGNKGEKGEDGDKGEPSTVPGDKGQKGETGQDGQDGDDGASIKGEPGDATKGDKGEVGFKGDKGELGAGDKGDKGEEGSGGGGLTSDANENTFGGTDAGTNLDADTYRNTFIGYQAGEQVNSGDDNTLLGWKAGDKITSGTKNCAVGSESLEFLQTGNSNVAMGWEAGRSCTGTDNTMIGDMAGRSMSGDDNIAIGRHAYSNGGGTHSIGIGGESVWTGGDYVIGIGRWASAGHFGDKTGSIGIGYYAGRHDNGPYNLYMGWESGFGYQVSTFASSYGNTNIGLGFKSLRSIYSGSGNIAIGASAGIGVSTGNNNIIIGNNIDVATESTSNQIIIGNSSSTKFSIPGINVVLKDNGGTPTEGHVLTVDSNGEASFEASSGGGGSSDKIEEGNTKAEVVDTGSNGRFLVETEGTERLRITNTGKVGIGTDNPIGTVDIFNSGADASDTNSLGVQINAAWIRIGDVDAAGKTFSNGLGVKFYDQGPAHWSYGILDRDFLIANTSLDGSKLFPSNRFAPFIIKYDGKVGIGTENPAVNLHSYHATTNTVAKFESGDSSVILRFKDGGTTNEMGIGALGNDFIATAASGGERFRITGAGKVGIGSTQPATNLDVIDSNQVSIKLETIGDGDFDDTIYRSRIGGTTASNYLYFGDADDSNAGQIKYKHDDDTLRFHVNSDPNVTGSGERFRIGSSGQIGLSGANYGTSGQVLTSNGASSAPTWQTVSGGGGGSSDKIEEGNTKAEVVDTGTNGHFLVETEGTERLRITSAGKVGINSTIPREKLDVSSGRIILDQDYHVTWANETTDRARIHGDSGNNFIVEIGSQNVEKFRITSDGRVGIGTTFPSGDLEVKCNINEVPAIISNYNNEAHIQLDAGGTGTGLQVSDTHYFAINHQPYQDRGTNNNLSEKFRIGSSGQIGLGGANYGTSGQVLTSNGSSSAPTWQTVSGGGGSSDKIEEGNTKAEVVDTGTNGHFLVETEGTERFRITSTGQLNVAGNMQFTGGNPELEFNNGGPRFRVPAANTLTIHTGGTLGSTNNEALRINSLGNLQAAGITSSYSGFMFGSSTFGGPDGEMYLYKSAASTATLRVTIDGPYADFEDVGGDLQMGSGSGTLRLSAGGNEKLRIGTSGQIGLGGANYGTSGQVLTSNGASSAPTWQTVSSGGGSSDKIVEGNTEAEVVDTGTNGHFKVTTEGTERLRIGSSGISTFYGNVNLPDNVELQLGTGGATGNGDLRIFSNGTEQIIWDNGVGGLVLQTASSPIELRAIDQHGAGNNEIMLKANVGGSVDLYTDGTKRFETTSDGVKITGGLQDKDGNLGTNGQILSSTGTELEWVDANSGDKGEKGEAGSSVKGEPGSDGSSVKGEPGSDGSSVKGEPGNSVKGEPGSSVKGEPGSSVKGEPGSNGTSIKGEPGSDGSASISNNADNRIITGSDTAGSLNAETNFTYNGSYASMTSGSNNIGLNPGDGSIEITRSSGSAYIDFRNDWNEDFDIRLQQDGSNDKLKIYNYAGTGGDLDVAGTITNKCVAKAFVNFHGGTNTNGNCTLRDSFGVSSVSDNSTGNYTVNWSSNFPNVNYTVTVSHSQTPHNNSTHGVLYTNGYAVNYVNVINFADDSGGNLVDKDVVCVVARTTHT